VVVALEEGGVDAGEAWLSVAGVDGIDAVGAFEKQSREGSVLDEDEASVG